MTAPEHVLEKRGTTLSGFWAELRSNKRAIGGLLAIVALLAGYGLLVLDDAVQAARLSYVAAMQRRDRLAASGRARDWPARAAASAALRQTLDKRLWPADSDGVARADMQDWVTGVAGAVGLQRLQVTIELAHPKGLPANVRQVTAKLTGAQSETALEGFLDRVVRDPHLIVVERLHAQQHPLPLLEMTLATYARIVAPGARPAAPR